MASNRLTRKFKRSGAYEHGHGTRRAHSVRRRIMLLSAVIVLLAAAAFPLLHEKKARAWWNPSWQYRMKITFDNSASSTDLPNFTVRVSLTSARFNYSKAQANGGDIRFVDDDGVTQLPYEIEQWTNGGTSELWVKVTQINATSSTDFIYMYYGNSSAVDASSPTNTWDSNYFIVHHENDQGDNNVADSTTYDTDGTPDTAGHLTQTTGKIAGAFSYSLSGGLDGYKMPQLSDTTNNYTNNSWTISAWVKTASTPASSKEFAVAGKRGNYVGLMINTSNQAMAVTRDNSGGTVNVSSTTALAAGTWYYIAQVVNLPSLNDTVYVNGVAQRTTAIAGLKSFYPTGTDTSQVPVVGHGDPSTSCGSRFGYCMDGVIDEVRYSNTNRSSDWIKAEYLSENDAFNTYGSEEIYPPDAPVLSTVGIAASTTPVLQMRASDQHTPTYLRYKVQICSDSACSSVIRTADQTSSQTGWSGQNAQTSTAYTASSTVGGSTLATYTYQAPALSAGTQYYWQAAAIDPGDSNTWGPWSSVGTFTTEAAPNAPTLLTPSNGATAVPINPSTRFELTDVDINGDPVKYKIDICSVSNCSVIVRTIDQTSSQTGWSGQNAGSGTTYTTDPAGTSSAIAIHTYQSPQLSANTQYWWRATAIDPTPGSNGFGSTSAISTFTTANVTGAGNPTTRVLGGTRILGGTKFGDR